MTLIWEGKIMEGEGAELIDRQRSKTVEAVN